MAKLPPEQGRSLVRISQADRFPQVFAQSGPLATVSPGSIIGHDIETNEPITIGDIERRSGLYILGKSGMGKTAVIENLIIQDIRHGHGLFFLDPHGQAIRHLSRAGAFNNRINDAIILDPQHETHRFGINLLACKDPTSEGQREATYNRAYGVFQKLFGKEMGEWGPWLQLILANTLRAFEGGL